MAETPGEGRSPQERPPWGQTIRTFLTPRGIEALEKALSLFGPHTSDELDEDVEKKLSTYKEAEPLLDFAVEDAIETIKRSFYRKGVLTKNLFEITETIDQAIIQKYPEHQVAGIRYGESYIFGEFKERIHSYIMTEISLKERTYRSYVPPKIKKQARRSRAGQGGAHITQAELERHNPHYEFFYMIDSPERTMQAVGGGAGGDNVRAVLGQYFYIKDFLIPFLKEKRGKFNNPAKASRRKLKAENDTVSELLVDESSKEVPLCTADNPTLFSDKSVTIQVSPVDDPKVGIYPALSLQVNFFEADLGEVVTETPELQEAHRVRGHKADSGIEHSIVAHLGGNLPAVFLRRNTGEIQLINAYKESLKLIAGDGPAYELLRKDILWYVSQLTCSRATLEKMYGEMFAPKPKRVKKEPAQAERSDEDGESASVAPEMSAFSIRNYPHTEKGETVGLGERAEMVLAFAAGETMEVKEDETDAADSGESQSAVVPGDVAESVDETLEEVRRVVEVPGHKMLLKSLIREREGVISHKGARPSQRAQELAGRANKTLYRGVEFPHLGVVVKPVELEKFMEELRAGGVTVNTIEDIEKEFGDDVVVRYETWVPAYSYVRGKVGEAQRRAIVAEVRKRVKGA